MARKNYYVRQRRIKMSGIARNKIFDGYNKKSEQSEL